MPRKKWRERVSLMEGNYLPTLRLIKEEVRGKKIAKFGGKKKEEP